MFKKLKIRSKILVSVLATALMVGLSLSTVSLVSFYNVKSNLDATNRQLLSEVSGSSSDTLKAQSVSYIAKIASRQAEKFNVIFSNVQSDVSSIALGTQNIYANKSDFKNAELPTPKETKKGDPNDPNSANSAMYCKGQKTQAVQNEMLLLGNIEQVVKPLYINNPDINVVSVATETGIYYCHSTDNNMEEFDPRTRKWYTDAIKAYKSGKKDAVWQDTYKDIVTGSLCVTCSKVFTDANGEILGVAAVDSYVDTIVNEIDSEDMSELGNIILSNSSGNIIMTSKNINAEVSKSFEKIFNKAFSGEKTIEIDKKSYALFSYPVETTGWQLFVLKDEAEILALAKSLGSQIATALQTSSEYISSTLRNLILILLITLIILIIFSIIVAKFTSQKITVPLKNLADEASRIGKGVFKRKIKVDSDDEVGELAKSFNKMTKDVVTYMRNFRKTTKEKEKISSELKVAKKIQESMLPCIFPPFPQRHDFDVFASMKPARMVGGDFYDFFLVDEDHLALVIGDVSGKGIAAALFMVITKTLIKNQAQCGHSPEKVFELVNEQLIENNDAGMFVTAFMGILNLKTGEFVYSNAGHNKPLVYKSSNGFNWIDTKPGFVLAGMDGIKYKLEKMQLEPNDMLYMYTDGVTEAHSAENALFSDEKLINTLNIPEVKSADIKTIVSKIDGEIKTFTEGAEQSDDITMLMIKYNGQE